MRFKEENTQLVGQFKQVSASELSFNGITLSAYTRPTPNHSAVTLHIKQTLDRLAILVAMPLIIPACLLLMLIIKLDSPGPVFFSQRRTGLNGKLFTIYKFRTMTETACNETGVKQAVKGDLRATRSGIWLRKTSLDELPQLFNVLLGDMSLIGPRPHAIEHDHEFRKTVRHYDARFRMKPGITGLAQIEGYRGYIACHNDIQGRVDLDNHYIEQWNLWQDIKILCKTVIVVIKTTNAH